MPRSSVRLFERLSAVTSVGFLSYFAEYAAFTVVLAWISEMLTVNFGLGVSGYLEVGTISGAYLVFSGLLAVPMGHFSDEFGRKRLSVIGCLLGSAALFSLVVIGDIGSVIPFLIAIGLALTALGLGHGTYTASTLAYVGDLAGEEDLGKSYGLIEDVEFAGYAFGPGIGGVIAVLIGRVPTFLLSATILLLAAGLASAFMKDASILPKPSLQIAAVGTSASSAEATPTRMADPHGHGSGASWRDFLHVLSDLTLGVTILTTVAISLAFTAFFLYVSIYAQNLSAVPLLKAAGAASGSIMAITCIGCLVPLGHLEDSTGRRMPVLVVGMVLGSLSLAYVFANPSLFSFLVSALVFGVALAMVRVSQYVILSERAGQANRATVMGANHAMEHAGYGLGALAGGIMTSMFGTAATFRYLSIFLLVTALLFFLFALNKKIR